MTLIQPIQQKNIFILMIAVLTMFLVVSAILVVILYNQFVNVNHRVSALTKEMKDMQTASAELKDKAFVLFSSENLSARAEAAGLVKDKNPEYVQVSVAWSPASR